MLLHCYNPVTTLHLCACFPSCIAPGPADAAPCHGPRAPFHPVPFPHPLYTPPIRRHAMPPFCPPCTCPACLAPHPSTTTLPARTRLLHWQLQCGLLCRWCWSFQRPSGLQILTTLAPPWMVALSFEAAASCSGTATASAVLPSSPPSSLVSPPAWSHCAGFWVLSLLVRRSHCHRHHLWWVLSFVLTAASVGNAIC